MYMHPFEDSDPFSADPRSPSCIPPADADPFPDRDRPFTKMLQFLGPRSPRRTKKASDRDTPSLRVNTRNIRILHHKAGSLESVGQDAVQHASDSSGIISEDDEVYPEPVTPTHKRMNTYDDADKIFRSPRKWFH